MLQFATTKLFFSGFIATFVVTLMVLPVFSSGALAQSLGISGLTALFFHLACGIFLFPFLYAVSLGRHKSLTALTGGVIWGVVLWIIAQALVIPLLGFGFFSSALASGNVFVAITFLLHCIYGLIFGASLTISSSKMREKVQVY